MNNPYFKAFVWLGIASLIVYAPIARGAVRLETITPLLVATGFLVFIWLLIKNNSSAPLSFQRSALDLPILLFTILAFSSLFFSIYMNASLLGLLRLSAYVGFYYLILNCFDFSMFKKMFILVIIVGTSLSAYGLLQYFGVFPHPWWSPTWSPNPFLASTFVNHNHFAGYLELVIPLAICITLESQRRSPFLGAILWIAIMIMASSFFLAQSRGALFSLGISFSLMVVVMTKRRLIRIGSVFALCLFLTAGFFLTCYLKPKIIQRINIFNQLEQREDSLETRVLIWQGSLEMIRERPWTGTGVGTFASGFSRFRPEGLNQTANFAHNEYLQTASETGIFAIPILAWILLCLIWCGVWNKPNDHYALGCFTGIFSLTLHGFVDFNFHIPANILMCILFSAYLLRRQ